MQALLWMAVALVGAGAFGAIARARGESVNGVWFVVAAVCWYALAYRFYSAFLVAKVLALDPTRETPSERRDDGRGAAGESRADDALTALFLAVTWILVATTLRACWRAAGGRLDSPLSEVPYVRTQLPAS